MCAYGFELGYIFFLSSSLLSLTKSSKGILVLAALSTILFAVVFEHEKASPNLR